MKSQSLKKLAHPLGGSNLNSYLRVLTQHQPLDWKQLNRFLFLATVNLLRSPSTWFEDRYCRSLFSTLKPPDNPIFIVGHWRSGTTYLHNMLARDEQFQHIKVVHQILPWNFLNRSSIGVRALQAVWARRLPTDNVNVHYSNYANTIDSPAEEEMAWGNMGLPCMTYIFYFPQLRGEAFDRSILLKGLSPEELQAFADGHHYFYRKVLLENPHKRLLVKNPANTGARIGWLKKLYPKAQFIHIYRNPFVVFPSMLKGVKKVIPKLALQPCAEITDLEIESSFLSFYRLLYERFFIEAQQLPKADLYQLRFEDFEADPITETAKIYQHFNWPNWQNAKTAMEQYRNTELRGYEKDRYTLTPRQIALIRQHWGFTLERWGYGFPDSILVKEEEAYGETS